MFSPKFRDLKLRFLAFPEGPGGFRQLREASRNHFHLSWYLSVPGVTSYDQFWACSSHEEGSVIRVSDTGISYFSAFKPFAKSVEDILNGLFVLFQGDNADMNVGEGFEYHESFSILFLCTGVISPTGEAGWSRVQILLLEQ